MSKKLQTFFTEKDGRVRQIVNKIITSLAKKTPLPNTFDGWMEIVLGWERSLIRHGYVRNFSLPLGFVMDAAKILRDAVYKGTVDRELYLVIKILVNEIDATHYKSYYKLLYKGQLDFTTFDDQQDLYKVDINCIDGGVSRSLKAGEATEFSIPFDDDHIFIKMDGIKITGRYKWQIAAYPFAESGAPTGALPTLTLVGNEQKAPGIAVFDVQGGYTFPPLSIDGSSTPYFMSVTVPPDGGIGTFTGTIYGNNDTPGYSPVVKLWIYNAVTGIVRTEELHSGGPSPIANPVIVINKQVVFTSGDRAFFYLFQYYDQSELNLEITTRLPTTYIKAYRPHHLGKKLIGKMTGDESKFTSTILQNSGFCLTSGDAIRGIATAVIKTVYNDYYKAMDVYHMIGMNVENDIIVVDGRADFYKTGNGTSLGKAKTFRPKPAKEFFGSSIKIGHKEQDIEDVNGKYDFNGYQIYTTPMKAVTDQIDLQSPYKAGPYEIEILRVNLEGKETTDDQSDNEVFVIDAKEKYVNGAINTELGFTGDHLVFYNGAIEFVVGQKFTTTSAINPGPFTIVALAAGPFGLGIMGIAEPGVAEASIPMTVQITRGQLWTLNRDVVPTAGVPDPTSIFNVRLSPHRLLMIHKAWLAGVFDGYIDDIEFESANRNEDLVADGLAEKSDVSIYSLGPKMFTPWFVELDTLSPVELPYIMEQKPRDSFLPEWLGNTYEGFLFRGGIAPSLGGQQKFRLLFGPDTDKTLLI
jgi:hypothetical protein